MTGPATFRVLTAGRHAAALALVIGLVIVPFSFFALYSVYTVEDGQIEQTFTLGNYLRFFEDAMVLPVFLKSCLLCLEVTLGCILLAFPVAYLIAGLGPRWKAAVVTAVVMPLLLPYVIKLYSVRLILGSKGLLNTGLLALGLIDGPLDVFVFNANAIVLTMIVLLLPYAVLPIALSLERIPQNLFEAAKDLGASAARTFFTVTLPLVLPGVAGAASFVFVLALGDFLTPQMVGGKEGFTFGRMVYSQFGIAFNWPFGAALAVILVVTVMVVMAFGRASAERRARS